MFHFGKVETGLARLSSLAKGAQRGPGSLPGALRESLPSRGLEWQQEGSSGWSAVALHPVLSVLQIKYHEEFEKSRMGPSGGEGLEPERRDSQESSSYRRPQEQQQLPHHIPTSVPGKHEAGGAEDQGPGQL